MRRRIAGIFIFNFEGFVFHAPLELEISITLSHAELELQLKMVKRYPVLVLGLAFARGRGPIGMFESAAEPPVRKLSQTCQDSTVQVRHQRRRRKNRTVLYCIISVFIQGGPPGNVGSEETRYGNSQ